MFAFSVLTLVSSNAKDHPPLKLDNVIDQIFNDIDTANAPGCAVGVIKDHQLVVGKGYGMANLEHDIPLSTHTVFRMASVSKQFTAMAVHLLADEGLIDLEKDIRTYLPELTNYGSQVTINAMLGHFAGMGDYDMFTPNEEKPWKHRLPKSAAGGDLRLGNEDYLSIAEFYDFVKRLPLRHAPDQKWEYSNLAYFLLSQLVEKQSGKTLRDYAAQKMFNPLDMNQSFFADDANEIIKNRASGYLPEKSGGYKSDMTNLFWVGDGGLHSSIEDMVIWDTQFYQPKLAKKPADFIRRINTPNSQHKTDMDGVYANGQFVTEKSGKKVFSHDGSWHGTRTIYTRIPAEKLSVIVLCNDASKNPAIYAEKVLSVVRAATP